MVILTDHFIVVTATTVVLVINNIVKYIYTYYVKKTSKFST